MEQRAVDSIQEINSLTDCHETAYVLAELIHKDGAGSWPPRANHAQATWPAALRPYKEIYEELGPLLATETPSLDDKTNSARIRHFRAMFRSRLGERVDLKMVMQLMKAADSGWGTIPVVQTAQLEKKVDLPRELVEPWECLQRHFGCASQSGNNTSCLVLNFDEKGRYVYKINQGLSETVTRSEEAFARIFYEVEILALPIYHDMVLAIISFARNDIQSCAVYMSQITQQLGPLLRSYYDRLHDKIIAHTAWLSHVQGFYAWGVGYQDDVSGNWIIFDGLSGNQVLLFQALDAFLGLKPYLSSRDQGRNMPKRQREFCRALEKHSFRDRLEELGKARAEIRKEFGDIVKRLRVFRTAHRTRARTYLSQSAPERLPMTAGKSLFKSNMDQSLEMLDEFMVGRLAETV